jgi:hypothetical protein
MPRSLLRGALFDLVQVFSTKHYPYQSRKLRSRHTMNSDSVLTILSESKENTESLKEIALAIGLKVS